MNESLRSSRFAGLARPWLPRRISATAKLLRLLPTLAYMAAIFHVSSLRPDQLALPADVSDRLLHFLAYFGLGLLVMFSVAAFSPHGLPAGRYLVAGAIGVLYGASDEWHQSFVPGREASMIDLGFDAGGVIAALVLLRLLLGRVARS